MAIWTREEGISIGAYLDAINALEEADGWQLKMIHAIYDKGT